MLDAQLEKEYKAEIENSRKLQSQSQTLSTSRLGVSQNLGSSSANGSVAPPVTSPEELEKDVVSLRFYEDLTELQIVNVKIKSGKAGKDVTLNCLHTNRAAARSELSQVLSHLVYCQSFGSRWRRSHTAAPVPKNERVH